MNISKKMDNAIDKLKSKLETIPTTNFTQYFDEIATILMNQCVITKNNAQYEIVEIEFYLYTPNHQDIITYPRTLAAGQWFFHQSGVDLTFESTNEHFGGILIRGLRRIKSNTERDNRHSLILGPQKCLDELWDVFDAFKNETSEYPYISASNEILNNEIRKFPRWISVKEDKRSEKIREWSNRVLANKFQLDNQLDKTDIVFKSPYRYIKYDLLHQLGWNGYGAKPMVQ